MSKRTHLLPQAVALWGVLLLAATLTSSTVVAYEFTDEFEDLIADESNVDEELQPGSVLLPSDVFNDGKPFFVERDPSTGAIDFNHKKTGNQIELGDGKLYDAIKESYVSDKKDVVVHQSTPNFHDFLNLPKMYSPENFVSISSSYATLKYQGSNKGSSNHREHPSATHIVAATSGTPAPATTTTTTTTTVAPQSSTRYSFNRLQYTSGGYNRPPYGGGSSTSTSSSGSYYTFPATSGRPITTSTSTTTTTTTARPEPSTTTEPTEVSRTTTSPQKQLFTRYPYKSTIKNKYLETSEQTRKKFFLPSTLALPGPTTTTTERAPPVTPVRTSSTYFSPSGRPHWPISTMSSSSSSTSTTSTAAPPTAPANTVRFPSQAGEGETMIRFTMPALKYEGSRPSPFRPLQSQTQGAEGSAGVDREQYASGTGTGNTKIELPKNPAVMSLSDIFSTLEQKKRLEAESNRVEESEVHSEPTTPPSIVLLGGGEAEGPKIEQSIDLSDHYVRYEVHPAPVPARPPHQQPHPQFVQYPVHQPNGHRPQLPAMDTVGGPQYVKYEVQKPQLNVVQYGTAPSMNNVVISPNQHSATFVVGSQQSVGGIGQGHADGGHFVGSVSQDSASAAALSASRPPYQMGQVLDEPTNQLNVGASVQVQVKPQDFIKTTSVRFPSESDDKYDNAPIISGTHKSEVLPPNGHSAPVRADQLVVFPPNQDIASTLHEVSNRIVFDSPAPPPTETLNQNELTIAPNPHYPSDLPEQLTPPSAPGQAGPQRPPRPPVQSQGPPFRYSELHRRPPTYPSDRPRPSLTLPNILPQFRPNAKISHGHPPYLKEPGAYRVPPSGMLVKTGPPLRKPGYPHEYHTVNSQPPTGAIRRTPLPTRLMARPSRPQSLPPASAELENRRHYRLPPPPPLMIKDRVFNIQPARLHQPPPPPPPPSSPQAAAPTGGPHSSNIVPSGPPRLSASIGSDGPHEPLEDSEFHRNPPQILRNILKDDHPGRPKLEPVVTLQMLQSKKQVASLHYQHPQEADANVETGGAPVPQTDAPSKDRPVYVVYPVKSTPVKLDDSGAGGHRGEQFAHAPSKTISPGTEYQNTPFSIASHFEQEPILTAKHKKPNPHGKLNFPYNLEKPDPLALSRPEKSQFARQPQQDLLESDTEYNLGEEPSVVGAASQDDQDLISSKLQRFQTDSTPIAIAYTPTESSPMAAGMMVAGPAGANGHNMRYNKPNGGYGAGSNYYYSPYGETQTEVSYLKLDDVDEFGNPSRRYEQSFQAPFQASISLNPVRVTNPYEGWSVVTSSPQALKLQQPKQQQQQQSTPQPQKMPGKGDGPVSHQQNGKNSIDRSDNEETTATGTADDGENRESASVAPSSSTFDPNSFQPELQGGFRPIYGADMKLSEQLNPDPQRSNVAGLFAEDGKDRDDGDATERPLAQPASTKLLLVESKPKTPVLKEEPEPALDLDLEAFFDQITKDYDDGESGLDDVTMSEETTNEAIPSSGESRHRAVEGRSSKHSAVPSEPEVLASTASSSPESATTMAPVVAEEPMATTKPT